MVGVVLTVVFGSVPATYIAVMPLFAFVIGISGLFTINSINEFSTFLLLTIWGSAGLLGVAALWLVPFFRESFWIVAGLAVGLIAISPVSILIVSQLDFSDPLDSVLGIYSISGVEFVTVPVVAFGWLLYFATKGSKT